MNAGSLTAAEPDLRDAEQKAGKEMKNASSSIGSWMKDSPRVCFKKMRMHASFS